MTPQELEALLDRARRYIATALGLLETEDPTPQTRSLAANALEKAVALIRKAAAP